MDQDERAELRAAIMARGGYACLGCRTPTKAEGQVCDECVGRGVRLENGTLYVPIEARF